jgi:hypothetical protein
VFFNSSGASVGGTGLLQATDSSSAWTAIGGNTAVAPAGTVAVGLAVAATTIPAAGEVHYFDAAWLRRDGVLAWGQGLLTLWDGYIDALVPRYDVDGDATVEVSATDLTKFLARYTAVDPWEYEVAADAPAHWYKFNEPEGAATLVDYGAGAGSRVNGAYATAALAKLGQAPVLLDNGDTSLLVDGTGGQFASVDLGSNVNGGGDFTLEWLVSIPADQDLIGDGQIQYLTRGSVAPVLTGTPTGGEVFLGLTSQPVSVGSDIIGVPYVQGQVDDGVSSTTIATAVYPSITSINTRAAHLDYQPHVIHYVHSGTSVDWYVDGVLASTSNSGTTNFGRSAASILLRYFIFGDDSSAAETAVRFGGFAIYNSALSSTRRTAHAAAARTPWASDTTGARVQRLLTLAGIPSAFQDIDTGATTLDRLWESIKGQSGLDLARRAETTELGRLFVSRDGKWTFRNRRTYQSTSKVTFGDGGGTEVPDSDLAQRHSDQAIVNRAIVQRVRGSAQQVDDAASQAAYGIVATSRLNTWYATDFEANDSAAYTVDKSKSPQLRTDELTVLAHRSTAIATSACLLELGDRITVNRRPPGGGTVQSKDTIVEGIAHNIDRRGTWDVTFRLSPADTRAYWTLGSSALGTDTRLSF